MGSIDRPAVADLVLVNGKVTPGPVGAPEAEAIAISRGKVHAVGTSDELRDLIGPSTCVLDLRGRRVVPGLIDSHVHVVRAGLSWDDEIRWGDVPSLAEALGMLSRRLDSLPPTGWLAVVGGWHPRQFSEGRPPTPDELTELAPDVPIFVQQQYDQAILNRAALERCGITAEPEVPFEGQVERDESGQPTGIIKGQAAYAYCLGIIMNQDRERRIANTISMQRELNGLGMTGAIDLGGASRMDAEAYRPVFEVQRRGLMTLRTRLYVHPRHGADEAQQIADFESYLHPRFGDDMLATIGIGEILFKSYYDSAGFAPLDITDELRERLAAATRLLAGTGWPINIHAIHDSSIDSILSVWEEIDKEIPLADLRFSFSHADAISPESLRRVRDLGVGIMVQDRMGMRTTDSGRAWGEDAVRTAPPMRSMLELGIPVGGGTDATVAAPINPWRSLWWMVTGKPIDGGIRRDPSECLTRAEALACYTSGSAWFSFDDHRLGSLAPGMLADLAVLSDDYFEVGDDDIPGITSMLTLVGGRAVHWTDEFADASSLSAP
jgi:predicted amidohydrolase YtcJ